MKTVNAVLLVLCVVCASLVCVPVSDAGPLRRIASAPFRGGRALVSRRLERRANGDLPRQRIVRGVFGGGWGGSCSQ